LKRDSQTLKSKLYQFSQTKESPVTAKSEVNNSKRAVMDWSPEERAVWGTARECVIEEAHLNLVCMEGLLTNATRRAQMKQGACAWIGQRANYDGVQAELEQDQSSWRSFQPSPVDFSFSDSVTPTHIDFGARAATFNETSNRFQPSGQTNAFQRNPPSQQLGNSRYVFKNAWRNFS
jgi:hypothetical protein